MAKTIVFFADGTWNGPEDQTKTGDGNAPTAGAGCQPDLTNVCKSFAWLDGAPVPADTPWGGAEMEKALVDAGGTPIQIAKYIHGVGNSQQLLDKVAGGAFGVGVVARIARGYTYISRNYLPGDRIVIVGFSRGAYTARALAGLIAGQGLLRPDLAASDDDTRYDTAVSAWYRWRHGSDTTFQKIVDGLTEWFEIHTAFSNPKPLDDTSFVPVKVAAVAVWDTVGALGIPVYYGAGVVDLFRFCDTTLSSNIDLGVHAVSLDEQRKPFTPTLWDNGPNVTQALFPGGHCDVGGGYAEHGLSDGPLLWLVDRLQQTDVGLKFTLHPPVAVQPDPLGPRHRAWIADKFWIAAGVGPRAFPAGLVVNDAVRQRINGGPDNLFDAPGGNVPYAPTNLPPAA
ncbi:DUF2235 domain-containing protein [Pararobbsia silviterrae]|uniref:DUF2235 domain-containing protein n=1 Tax=Pararobbsia silviterrae TaxID=1792498 RepID=A0A494X291_9BURK|nr:DUF2235 domain-containing protein [Pararobbsia silviterrae]RKP44450.1 DUF2235 domain-containing protein [Pararobbsia silviterrae]